MVDDNGNEGIITKNILHNFQTALVKRGDIVNVVEDGITHGGNVRFKMIPDPQKCWGAEIAEKYKIGSQVTCKILQIFQYGVFVEIEKNVVGLVELNHLINEGEKIQTIQAQYNIGDDIDLYITAINPEEQKIFLSRKKPIVSAKEMISDISVQQDVKEPSKDYGTDYKNQLVLPNKVVLLEEEIQLPLGQDDNEPDKSEVVSPSGIIPLPKPVEKSEVNTGETTLLEKSLQIPLGQDDNEPDKSEVISPSDIIPLPRPEPQPKLSHKVVDADTGGESSSTEATRDIPIDQKSILNLKKGQHLTGKIKSFTDFGVFVDLA